MEQNQKLSAKVREIFGKKSKALFKAGYLPATVYGRGVDAVSLTVNKGELENLLKKSGETELINLEILGEKKGRPVLVHQTQRNPLNGSLVHVEFLQVDLNRKVSADIPLIFVGIPQAVKEGKGNLLELLDEVEVEGLPQSLPSHIEIDVTSLSEPGQFVKVSDLTLLPGLVLKTHSDELVCKIEVPKVEEEVKPVEVVTEAEGTVPVPEEAPKE